MASKAKEMKKYKKRSALYILVAAIAFGLVSLGFYIFSYFHWIVMFTFLTVFYTGLSIAHLYTSRYMLPWTRRAHIFWVFLFAFIISLVGSIVHFYAYYFLSHKEFNYVFLIPAVFFYIPIFVFHTYKAYYSIPQRDYKKWYYPFGQTIDDPTDRELESPFVISFEFEKKFDDAEVTTFRAKAPKYMKFGRLFYFFINDYNSRHPESKIEYIYDKSKSYGWIFFKKPNWYETLSYINPDDTIADNRIEENTVIICKRIMD
jgi:hypothetical protein